MRSVAEKMRLLEPTAQLWMQIDPYCQRQKCRPKVHADIRGGSSWRGRQMKVGLSTTAIFSDLSGYFFGNFRDNASNIIWRYAAPCRPVIDCKRNDLEWPWVAISCQNPFSASSDVHETFQAETETRPETQRSETETRRSASETRPRRCSCRDLDRDVWYIKIIQHNNIRINWSGKL